MAMQMRVDIVSAEAKIFSGMAEMVVATAIYGEVGIVPRHAQMLTLLKPGQVRVINGETEEIFYISSGLLEVQPYAVTVLADTAARADNLDEAAALEAKRQAEEALLHRKTNFEYAKAAAELAQAVAQIQAIQKIRKLAK